MPKSGNLSTAKTALLSRSLYSSGLSIWFFGRVGIRELAYFTSTVTIFYYKKRFSQYAKTLLAKARQKLAILEQLCQFYIKINLWVSL